MNNVFIYVLKLLQIIQMALGLGQAVGPIISAAQAVLQAAADAGRDISDDEILALDSQRHALEQQIQAAQ